MRYAASQLGLSTPLQMLQQNLFVWFYTAYVHRLGTYLIDLNSGRLRVGARATANWSSRCSASGSTPHAAGEVRRRPVPRRPTATPPTDRAGDGHADRAR